MSAATATSAPAAGWYPDPHGPDAQLRWWDGAAWTNFTTDPPEPEPEAPHPFADIIADVAHDEEVPQDDDTLDDIEPIEFSWSDPADLFEVTVAETRAEPSPFAFRVRSLDASREEPTIVVPTLPVYESPVATIASPVSVRVEVPVRVDLPVRVEPAALPEPEPEPQPAAESDPDAEVAAPPAPPAGLPRRKVAIAGTGAAVAIAAAAALLTNLIAGDDVPNRAKPAGAGIALSAAQKGCMKEWNTTASGGAAQLRVTLGQFDGALAKVGPVKPLPGTVMAADSCALTVYDPTSDTHAVFVSGVKDQVGYLDVTSYPRSVTYGWPKSTRQANVSIRPDGSLRAL